MPIKHTVTVYNKSGDTKVVKHGILLGKTPYVFEPMQAVEIPQRAWSCFRYRFADWMDTGEPPEHGSVQPEQVEARKRGRPRKVDADVSDAG